MIGPLRFGAMADSPPIPDKLWPKVRWTLDHHPWIFLLVAVEALREEHFGVAAIFFGVFVLNLYLASKWDHIAARLGGQKMNLLYIGILAACLIGAGFSIARLIGSPEIVQNGPGSTPPPPPKKQAEYVTNFNFNYDREWGEKPLHFRGEITKSISRLRFYIQYFEFGAVGKASKLIPLTVMTDAVRGTLFDIPLIYKHKAKISFYVAGRPQTDEVEKLYWASENGPEVYAAYPSSLVGAVIVIIGPDSEDEQHINFKFLRVSGSTKMQIFEVSQGE